MNLNEYYQYYLTLHQNKWCRRLHLAGQVATILFIIFCVSIKAWWALITTPFIIYPFAWSGHYFFEKNKPAAFSSPMKAKICDFLMIKDMLTGKIKL
jgi:hypothetical protein